MKGKAHDFYLSLKNKDKIINLDNVKDEIISLGKFDALYVN